MIGSRSAGSRPGSRVLLVDTAVLAYAVGADHPQRAICRAVVAAAGEGRLELHASVEMVQELLFHRMRMTDRSTAVRQARDASRLCVLHDFDAAVMARALELVAGHHSIGGRDAVHAATALMAGLPGIISPDRGFDGIAGLVRVDPSAVVHE